MNGTLPLLPLHAFVMQVGTTYLLHVLMMGDFPLLGTKISKFCSVHSSLPDEITFTKFGKEHKAQSTKISNS